MSDEVVSGWRVATYTGGQGNCVEVGRSATTIAVRDTKNREDGPVLRFDPSVVARVYAASQGLAPFRRTGPRPEDAQPPGGGLRMHARPA